MMKDKTKSLLFFSITAAFVLLNSVAILKEIFLVPLLSGMLLIVYLLIYRVDLLMYLMALITPLSIIFTNEKVNIGLSIPSEVIMISLTILFFCRILYDISLDPKIVKHPISISIYFYLAWMLFTCITSELPVVSIKFWLSKIWFIVSCYFMVIQLIKNNLKNFVNFVNCYALGLAVVVIFSTVNHALQGFTLHGAHFVMRPFYNDHTAYGAVLALFIPLIATFYFLPHNTKWRKIYYVIVLLIFITGFYFSYSRAAWISLIVAIAVWIVLKMRIKLSWLLAGLILVGSLFYYYYEDILYKMERNQQDSSGKFVEHLQSISNISTDASNVERFNRWFSAFDMIKERPIVGWGPGTYQFTYAAFQKGKYKTIISTNFGNRGNAHSEYIGPCAETGFVGLVSVLLLVFMSLYYGIKTYIFSQNYIARLLSLAAVLALITYFIHGCLNNFLDTDKLSLPFWMLFALIVVLNTNYLSKESKSLNVN